MHILLVEDNNSLALGLKVALSKAGFVVNNVASGQFAVDIINSEPPDAVILDLGLPDLDGLQVIKKAKKSCPNLPILILSARDSTDDKVTGLELGADDFLTKPFDIKELIARLRVIERRLFGTQEQCVEIGDVVLSTAHHQVMLKGAPLELSRREYALLKSLMESAGRVITRSTLESRLYSWGDEVVSNAIEVHIHNLRKKIGSDFIKTVRGVGYMVPKK